VQTTCQRTNDPAPDYCQSCYALIGDLAKHAILTLQPNLRDILPLLVKGMNLRFVEATNNAIWALGEILMKSAPDLLQAYVPQIYSKVMDVFEHPEANTILETCAVTIGRLALINPAIVAQDLQKMVKPLCIALRNLPDDAEKEDALRGLCEAVRQKPEYILPDFQSFCDVIASFYNPNPPLRDLFGNLLHAFKNQANPAEWKRVFDSFQPRIKNTLQKTYNL